MARAIFYLAVLQDPGEAAVYLAMGLPQEAQTVCGGFFVGGFVEGDRGQGVVIDEAAGADEVLGVPVVD